MIVAYLELITGYEIRVQFAAAKLKALPYFVAKMTVTLYMYYVHVDFWS